MSFNPLAVRTPAQDDARALAADVGLAGQGFLNLRCAYWNLPAEALYEEAVFRGEGRITRDGALVVDTGAHTSRSAQDKFIVHEPESSALVWWGEYNHPLGADSFGEVLARVLGFFQGRDAFVQDLVACAPSELALPIRIVTEHAWQSLFVRTMFAKPPTRDAYRAHVPQFTVIAAPSFRAQPATDATRTETFVLLDLARRLCLVGGTRYAGELKKAIFTVVNYLAPLAGALPLHCSANVGSDGDTALFLGLSGTGKTTLSADPRRSLVGDDEHVWGDDGIFNVEDGCYAKVIRLSETAEPEIHRATHTFGTILENVAFDPVSRRIDLDSDVRTENTRAAYSLDVIANAVPGRSAGHPRNVVLLTCDAQGVLPPVARLSTEQALYHFVSGYTSKVGGTEAGVGLDPEITFSTCFGAPFLVHHPLVYAEALRRKLELHGTACWLVNTGWVGGPYGVGERIAIRHTRRLLDAALSGELDDVETYVDPVFEFEVPSSCPGLPDDVLHPSRAWSDEDEYWRRYRELAGRYRDNFQKLAGAGEWAILDSNQGPPPYQSGALTN